MEKMAPNFKAHGSCYFIKLNIPFHFLAKFKACRTFPADLRAGKGKRGHFNPLPQAFYVHEKIVNNKVTRTMLVDVVLVSLMLTLKMYLSRG